ncbi:MAG: hypothetical protein JXR84_11940 [Anaerolineae bacterium]|nr:hypothetical protein [Anaerolineae bacterium]
MKRFSVALFLALVMTLLVVIPSLAQEAGHIYGIAFVDANGNGSWDPGEAGIADVAVNFSGNPNPNRSAKVTLRTAWTDNLVSALSGSQSDFDADMQCSHFTDVHIGQQKGCNGTFGLLTANSGGMYYVWVTAPAGFTYVGAFGSAASPYTVPALPVGTSGWLEFPFQIATGADAVPAASPPSVFIAKPLPPNKSTLGAYPVKAFVY